MILNKFNFEPIGIIHSPLKNNDDIPRKKWFDPHGFEDVVGEVEVFKNFEPGLDDIDGFSHLILVFVFHESMEKNLYAHPPFDGRKRGIFATRSPHRPNPIGISVVKLEERERNILKVSGLDMFDGTPLLDIKPYTPRDKKESAVFGWLDHCQENHDHNESD